jgi:5-methylcytosine-specific restriction enzyme A
VTSGRCPDHQRQSDQWDRQRRGSARERGYGPQWDRYSRWLRQQVDCPECGRNHALCERCQAQGRIEASELIDHIIPIKSEGDPLFWEHGNHQGLSRNCHAMKTAEDRRQGLTR